MDTMMLVGMAVQTALVERLLNNRISQRPTLLVGPAGCGKTMLARRFGGGGPFRAPHHTVSTVAVVGKGSPTFAGMERCEYYLAHNGTLFLDELPEFRRDTLDKLRSTIRNREVMVPNSLCPGETTPAKVWLTAAANACPCGWAGSTRECKCSEDMRARYWAWITPWVQDFGFDTIYIKSEDRVTVLAQPLRPMDYSTGTIPF